MNTKYFGSTYALYIGDNRGTGHDPFTTGNHILYLDSDRQTLSQGLNFSQETRPKTKFFSLLIYAGYPMQ